MREWLVGCLVDGQPITVTKYDNLILIKLKYFFKLVPDSISSVSNTANSRFSVEEALSFLCH